MELKLLKNLWNYRYFVLSSIRSEMKGRFARSYLGGLWFILHPLAQALIFSILFSQVMQARVPNVELPAAYPIYLLAGLAAWGLFSEILNRSVTIFIEHASVMKKIAFPRLCLPIIVWGSALANHLFLLTAILVICIFLGHFPTLAWLYIVPGILLVSVFAFGLGIFLGVLNVFSRDVAQVMTVIMQLWFWLTPIVYATSILPDRFKSLIEMNPMTPVVAIYQNAILLNSASPVEPLAPVIVLGMVMVVTSLYLFKRASPDLVDAL